MSNDIQTSYKKLNQRVIKACSSSNRSIEDITVLAASKQRTSDDIRSAYNLNVRHFGENYLQEALTKIEELFDLNITWHFIGHIQSNKITKIARHFSWLHTLDSKSTATKLNKARPKHLGPINCCIQINSSKSEKKHGIINFDDVVSLIEHCHTLPYITIRGLMTIPSPNPLIAKQEFETIADILHDLNTTYPSVTLDTLSMGMSNDLETAIESGSTLIRIGSALFGARH
jgi:PLP dependent protein